MENEKEGQSLRDYGNRKKRYKKRRRAVICAVLIILATAGGLYFLNLYNRSYRSCSVMKTTDVPGENASGYLKYGNSIVKYGKDGAVAIDQNGKLLWNGSYELQDPIADTSGKYVVIAGKGSKEIHIFDNKGEVNIIHTDYEVIKTEIASSQGVVAALMEDGDTNYIQLFDTDGTKLTERVTDIGSVGYPLDISLSEDGKKLVTSYLSYAGGKVTDIVSFYNFGEVGQNHTDGLVGCKIFEEGIIVPRVEFINNDTVSAYSDNGLSLYSMKELPGDLFMQKVDGKIKSILYNKDYVGLVLQAEGTTSQKIMIYDRDGKTVLEKPLDFNYKKIYLSEEEIIMYDNTSCLIMKLNGKVKFKYTFDSNIEALYPINNLNKYYLADENVMKEIQLGE